MLWGDGGGVGGTDDGGGGGGTDDGGGGEFWGGRVREKEREESNR